MGTLGASHRVRCGGRNRSHSRGSSDVRYQEAGTLSASFLAVGLSFFDRPLLGSPAVASTRVATPTGSSDAEASHSHVGNNPPSRVDPTGPVVAGRCSDPREQCMNFGGGDGAGTRRGPWRWRPPTTCSAATRWWWSTGSRTGGRCGPAPGHVGVAGLGELRVLDAPRPVRVSGDHGADGAGAGGRRGGGTGGPPLSGSRHWPGLLGNCRIGSARRQCRGLGQREHHPSRAATARMRSSMPRQPFPLRARAPAFSRPASSWSEGLRPLRPCLALDGPQRVLMGWLRLIGRLVENESLLGK